MIGWLTSLVLAPLILVGLGAAWAARIALGLVTGRWIATAALGALLALVFLMTVGASGDNAALALGVGLCLAMVRPIARGRPDLRRVPRRVLHVVPLAGAMLVEIARGSLLMTQILLGLRSTRRAGLIEVPLGDRSEAGATLSGLLATTAPGTMLVDIDWSSRRMLVHAIDAGDLEQTRESLQRLYRRRQRPVLP